MLQVLGVILYLIAESGCDENKHIFFQGKPLHSCLNDFETEEPSYDNVSFCKASIDFPK